MTPDQFRAARLRLGLKQDQLADLLGVSETSVANRERGHTTGATPKETLPTRVEELALAALALGVVGYDGETIQVQARQSPPLTGRGTGRKRPG